MRYDDGGEAKGVDRRRLRFCARRLESEGDCPHRRKVIENDKKRVIFARIL